MTPKKAAKCDEMVNFLKRVRKATTDDLTMNHSEDYLFANAVEEMGEWAAARTVERGYKSKELKESSKIEAVDLVICALSLYFISGGKVHELPEIGNDKLAKWEKRLK